MTLDNSDDERMIAVDQEHSKSKCSALLKSVRSTEKRNTMSTKSNTLSAKEVAAMCDMTPKNFRKHLRSLSIAADRKEKRYSFTSKQANKIVAQLTAEQETEQETVSA